MFCTSTNPLGIWALCATVLWGCEPKVVDFKLNVITTSCVAPAPLENATHLRLKVTGDGLEPMVAFTPISTADRSLVVPQIPAGKNRVVEVRAYEGEPNAGGKVVAMGRTLPFEVPDVASAGSEPIELNVFLRRVNVFLPPSSILSLTNCSRMISPRAGHTATLLKNGKVFIAGGYQLVGGKPTAIYKAEFFNPATGAFEDAPDVGLVNSQQSFTALPRAFHTATLLASGQVLLWGGEEYGTADEILPRASVLVFDPDQNSYGGVPFSKLNNIGRARHAAVLDKNGKVLVVGGHTRKEGSAGPVLEGRVEWFDPATTSSFVVDQVTLPRSGMSAAAVQGGAFVVVTGGTDGTTLQDDVNFLEFDGTTFVSRTTPGGPRLNQARRAAAMTPFRSTDSLLVVGGYTDGVQVTSTDSTELLTTGNALAVSAGPTVSARGDICIAPLPDGRVLAVGGRSKDTDGGGLPKSEDKAELLVPQQNGQGSTLGIDPLKVGRYFHSCTVLNDGSVLVLGGVSEFRGTLGVLQDAYLFIPPPLD